MAAPVRSPLIIRLPLVLRIFEYAFGALWVGILATALFGSDESDPASLVFLVAFMAVGVLFVARMVRAAVIADDRSLLVRNFYRTKRFSWAEIEDFRTGRAPSMPWGRMIFVLARDGDLVGMDVTMTSWGFGRRRLSEAWLADLRSRISPPAS